MNIYLFQNFESIDTQTFLGGRYAYPIPYFDNGPVTDGLHIGGSCHEQGRSNDSSRLCQVQYRRGGCHLRIWTASAGRELPVQLRHRRDSNTRLNLSLHSEVQVRWYPSITTSNTYSPRKVSHIFWWRQVCLGLKGRELLEPTDIRNRWKQHRKVSWWNIESKIIP